MAIASIVKENSSHNLSRNPKKVRAILPLHTGLIDETQERFVNKSSRLQGMTDVLMSHIVMRQTMQFSFNEWH